VNGPAEIEAKDRGSEIDPSLRPPPASSGQAAFDWLRTDSDKAGQRQSLVRTVDRDGATGPPDKGGFENRQAPRARFSPQKKANAPSAARDRARTAEGIGL